MTDQDTNIQNPDDPVGKSEKDKRKRVDELADIFARRLFEIAMLQIEYEHKLEKDRKKDREKDMSKGQN